MSVERQNINQKVDMAVASVTVWFTVSCTCNLQWQGVLWEITSPQHSFRLVLQYYYLNIMMTFKYKRVTLETSQEQMKYCR